MVKYNLYQDTFDIDGDFPSGLSEDDIVELYLEEADLSEATFLKTFDSQSKGLKAL